MLLEGVDPMAAVVWYQSGQALPDAGDLMRRESRDEEIDRIEAEIGKLAAYVCRVDSADGERLRNYAESVGIHVLTLPWAAMPLPTRMAFSLFAQTCLSVHRAIDLVQAAERAARAIEEAPAAPALKREDSIFEETESLGETIPGVLEALAAHDRAWAGASDKDRAARDRIAAMLDDAQDEAAIAAQAEAGACVDPLRMFQPSDDPPDGNPENP